MFRPSAIQRAEKPVNQANGIIVLWNPVAVAAWSLLFTPVFGSILLAQNWEALGRDDRARRCWSWTSLAIFYWFYWRLHPDQILATNLLALGAWFFFEALPQITHLRDNHMPYSKKAWMVPLISAAIANLIFNFLLTIGSRN